MGCALGGQDGCCERRGRSATRTRWSARAARSLGLGAGQGLGERRGTLERDRPLTARARVAAQTLSRLQTQRDPLRNEVSKRELMRSCLSDLSKRVS